MHAACVTPLYLLGLMLAGPDRPASIGYVDSEAFPIRCHWSEESEEDKCSDVLESAELAWQVQVVDGGFNEPMGDDDGILDIYLTTDGTGGGAYTLGTYEDDDGGDDRKGCSSYIAIDSSISRGALPSFVVHEFQHVTQYATDFLEPTLPIWEAVAASAEQWTVESLEVAGYYVKDFQREPWLGILGDSYELSYYSLYEYGAAVWILHLDANWGDENGAAARDLWEAAAQNDWNNEPDVLDAYDAVTGDWKAALVDLSIQRARIGTDLAPNWTAALDESRMAVSVDQDIDAASLPVTAESIDGPVPTGVAYFQVDNLTEGEPVTFTVTSDANTTWGLVVVEGERDGSAMGQGLEWTPEASSLLVGVLSFGKDGFDADARLNQASFTLEISGAEEGDSGDTGETDDGSGDGGGGGGGGGAGGGKGCGCASPSGATPFGGTVQPGLLGLLLAGLALRRRARDDDRA